MSSKGKQVVASKGKRKCDSEEEKSKPRRKRKNPGVLQFFEDAADVDHHDDDDPSDDSDFDNDFMDEGFDVEPKVNNEPGKAFSLPVFPKEEELDEEFDKVMEERYRSGSGFVTYAGDDYEAKKSIERNSLMPSAKDPTIWKVKCMVGRERHSVFCLMQKFVDLKSLGTKLKIISAFTVDNIKGFIFIEADKQCDINEACKGLCSIYSTRVTTVPKNEVSHLVSVRNKYNEVSEGMWARVRNGNYKGDLAQVVAVNEARKRATIKLIPRIDLQLMAQKFGGGVTAKKSVIPAPRLISSSELEEFRPLIQYRRDRDTGKVFEVLDGLMLKDGYLYKKVSIDSLSCTGVMPLDEELLKFKASEISESDDVGWLSQLYGEQKKKLSIKIDKGCEKGEGSSSSSMVNSYELFDLVCFGRKDFGIIIGMEKDDHYKILKDGPEGSAVVTVEQNQLNGSIDKKFIGFDLRKNNILFNDTVRVLEGPSKDRQGIIRHIYRGTIFLYDENETENCGYFCCKSQMCEKIKLSVDASNEKGGSSAPGFEDFMSSPKSPLSPKKPWQARENNSDFNRGDKDGMFSIGQTLRIRVGPLKGYLCRVLAIRHSDVTVKLDSQQKVLTVKDEHLSEVRGKSSSMSTSEDPGSSSFKPFDLLGTDGSSRDWMDGAGTSAEGDGWNAGRLSAGGSSWPSFSTSGNSLQPESNPANLFGSVDNGMKKDVENTAWESKVTPNQNSSWGTSSADEKAVANSGWGKSEDGWGKAAAKTGSGSGASDSWGKAMASSGDQAGSSKDAGDSWGQAKLKVGIPADSSNDVAASWGKNKNVNDDQDGWKKSENWDKGKNVSGNSSSNWGGVTSGKDQLDSWGKGKDVVIGDGSTWGKAVESEDKGTGWNNLTPAAEKPTGGWGNAGGSWSQPEPKNTEEVSGWKKAKVVSGSQTTDWGSGEATGWGKGESCNKDQTDSWNKPRASAGNGGSWNKQDGGSSWGKQDGGSSWSKEDGEKSFDGGRGSGGRRGRGGRGGRDQFGKEDGGSSWGKQDGGSSWSKEDGGKSFDGGRGSGGRRGRGGRGGRDQFGGGRSFNQGPSSGWSNEGQENNWTSDGMPSGNPSGWNNDQAGGWGKSKAFDGGKEDGWKKPNASAGDDGSSWNKGWGADKEIGESAGWKGVANDTGGNLDSNWGKQSNWNPGSSDADKNQDSGWGKKSNWNSGSGDAGGNQDSNWGKKGDWNPGSSDANQDSGWGKKSDWNSRNAFSGNQSVGGTSEDQTQNFSDRTSGGSWGGGFGGRDGSDRGSFRGRGGSDRGGFGGRGRSDRGGYGGRGRSDRGGFGGRGRSDRGGFGGRGRGRRDWNNSNDSGEDKPFDWKKGANNNGEGWKSNDGAVSWNQGGGDKGQLKSWNSGSGETSSQAGGWNSKGLGGNQTAVAKDAGGSNDIAGSWNKGTSSITETGGSQKSWNSGSGETSNQAGGWNSKGSGWNQTAVAKDAGGSNDLADRWNKGTGSNNETGGNQKSWNSGSGGSSNQAGGWNSKGSSWNQTAVAKDAGGSNDLTGSWNKGTSSTNETGGSQKTWNSGSGGTSNQAGGWNSKGLGGNQTAVAKDAGGSNDLTGGGNKGTSSTNETGGGQGNPWKSSDVSGGGQWSSRNQSTAATKEVKETNDQGNGWNKASGGGAQAGAWDNKGSGWNGGTGSGNGGAIGDQAETCNQSNAADRGQSSDWNRSKDTKEGTSGSGEPTDSWGKATAAAAFSNIMGKGSDGNGKGGW